MSNRFLEIHVLVEQAAHLNFSFCIISSRVYGHPYTRFYVVIFRKALFT
nr:MAG TPA: hypothetical protein [Caudoviricetes sp.]